MSFQGYTDSAANLPMVISVEIIKTFNGSTHKVEAYLCHRTFPYIRAIDKIWLMCGDIIVLVRIV